MMARCMWSRRLRDGTRRTSDGSVRSQFWRVPCIEACGKHVMGPRRQHLLGQNLWGIQQRHWESTRGHSVNFLARTGSFVWCCRCGARAAKFEKKLGESCVGHPRAQEHGWVVACLLVCLFACLVVWLFDEAFACTKENRFLGSPKLFTA